jgi:hypothetical protein
MHWQQRLVSRRAISLLCLFLGLCAITRCYAGNVAPGDENYPRSNPSPSKFLTLHGTIDPALDLSFRVDWRASDPHCQFAASWIEGAFVPYSAWSALTFSHLGGIFSVRIPIDGVLPGRCQWRFAGVRFGGSVGFKTELIATNSYPLQPGQSPNGIAVLRCKWNSEPHSVDGDRAVRCSWPKDEDPNASVLGGVLWWHPEANDLEVHFIAD